MINKRTNKIIAILAAAGGIVILALLLRPVFRGTVVLPQVFHLGPLAIHYYGLILALAIIAAYCLAAWRGRYYGFTTEQLDRLVVVLVVCGFIGARLYHVATELGFYVHHPAQVLAVWQGGLGIFGAILGGLVGLIIVRNRWFRGVSFLTLLDWLAPSLLLGQIIGRFGNLFNYEIFGYPTNLPWKMFVPAQFRPQALQNFNYFHPLFLYEAILNILILLLLWRFMKRGRPVGSLFFAYLFLYNAGRFFLELYKTDSMFIGMVRLNSIITAILAFVALAGFIYLNYAQSSPPHSQRRP